MGAVRFLQAASGTVLKAVSPSGDLWLFSITLDQMVGVQAQYFPLFSPLGQSLYLYKSVR
jgi:hypothetical protein